MVLWLSAALSAIALSVAIRVRGETERTSTEVDALRGHFLAAGAIERALLWIQWGPQYRGPGGAPLYFQPPMPVMRFDFPTGRAQVEVIPEGSKLNINHATPDELMRLLVALAVPPDRAQAITAGIIDWRSPTQGGSLSQFDDHYLSVAPTFQARHASFEEIEELLLIRGMTPDIFYGRYDKDAEGRLVPRVGLKDCVTVWGSPGVFDVNTVQPAVMQAIGIPADIAAAIVQMRRSAPITSVEQLKTFTQSPAMGRLGFGASALFTLRATAEIRLPNGGYSDVRRTISALVSNVSPQYDPPFHIMRWYDNASSPQ